MKIYRDLTQFEAKRPVITIGVFDGVHTGHREILKRLKETADTKNGESVVVTFWPHPRLVLQHDTTIKLINTLEEKLLLLEKASVQNVVVIPFTEEFSQLSSHQFITDFLINKLKVNHLIVGFNHQFGKDREGNFESILKYAQKSNFTVEMLDAKMIENEKISSTKIRVALNDGDIHTANKYLGYNYSLTGQVVQGDQIGRTIGYPTANVKVQEDYKLIPKPGVYAVEVEVNGEVYIGMLNMGFRPTLKNKIPTFSIEVNIINFEADIYDKNITLYFKSRIRDEKRFDGLQQLKDQLKSDRSEVIKLLGQ